jgi:hypothetical protein
MDTKELWKPIEYNPYMLISSKGRIKRLPHGKEKGRIQEDFFKDRDGYCRVNVLNKDGKYTNLPIHRLVALAFIENPDNKPHVNHIDGDRTNNTVENLEWVTPRENVLHSFKFGNRKICKEVPRTTILTDYQVSQIEFLRQYYSLNQLSKLFNISYTTLKNIVHKRKQCERLDNQQPSNYKSIYN